MNSNKRDKDNKRLITEFTNEWLRLRARFQVKDLFINLQMLKLFTMAPCCYIAYFRSIVQDLLSQTHVCFLKPLSQTWQKGLSKHEKNPKYINCSSNSLHQKVLLEDLKSMVLIVFKAQMRNPNFPQDLASFWNQIPLQMA